MALRHAIFLGFLAALAAPARAQLFESDSKRFGDPKMDIVVRELERRPRASVLAVETRAVGSSVGASFFLLCSVRDLARVRGGYRYVVKLEERPAPRQMLVGFLRARDESPETLGAEFASLRGAEAVIDLEPFAPICDAQSGR